MYNVVFAYFFVLLIRFVVGKGCEDDLYEILVIAAFDVSSVLPSFFTLWFLRKERDPLHMISELQYGFMFNICVVQPGLLLHVVDPWELSRKGYWEWGHMITIGFLLMYCSTIPYQLFKSRKYRGIYHSICCSADPL